MGRIRTSGTRPFAVAWVVVLAGCLLSGCGAGSDGPLDNYLTRLSRSLDRAIEPGAERLPPLPRARDLKLDLQSGSIGLLDFLALGGCELSITIGSINSSLGKLATESQRLLLELEFLSLAPACIGSLDPAEDGELITALQAAVADKQRGLPARIWNATLGGPEYRAFWKRPGHLGNYPADTGSEVVTALARLAQLSTRWLDGDYEAGSNELEHLLGDIRRGDGGALLASLDVQRAGLAGAASALQDRVEGSPVCLDNRPSPEGRIVDNVVRKFFIGEVQPWSVQVARRRTELISPVLALELNLAQVAPPAYRQWSQQRDQLLSSAVKAPREHARGLAAILESCGLRPGVESGETG